MITYNKIIIIFRTCDSVNAVNKSARPFDLSKKDLIKVCFKSLWNSVQGHNCKIVVLGDNLSEEMKNYFSGFDVELIEGIFGNDESIRKSIKTALKFNDNEWVYFCEDDYLHSPESFNKIITLINEKDEIIPGLIQLKVLLRKRHLTLFSIPRFFNKPNIVIFPSDYPDRYKTKFIKQNFVFHTSNSHWRQISDTTFTFLMQVSDIKKHSKTLLKASNRANDRYLSKKLYGKSFFFKKLLCVSPMPSLTTHMHQDTMSPLIDWKQLVDKLIQEIKIK